MWEAPSYGRVILPGSGTKLVAFPEECHVFHGFLLSSALVALSQSCSVSHQPAGGTVSELGGEK